MKRFRRLSLVIGIALLAWGALCLVNGDVGGMFFVVAGGYFAYVAVMEGE